MSLALDFAESRLQNRAHASVRVRVSRLRPPLRVSDAGTGDGELSGLRQRRARKQLSVFAVANGPSSSPGTPSAAPCGMCGDTRGPGACSIN